jgi:hypothetical protein
MLQVLAYRRQRLRSPRLQRGIAAGGGIGVEDGDRLLMCLNLVRPVGLVEVGALTVPMPLILAWCIASSAMSDGRTTLTALAATCSSCSATAWSFNHHSRKVLQLGIVCLGQRQFALDDLELVGGTDGQGELLRRHLRRGRARIGARRLLLHGRCRIRHGIAGASLPAGRLPADASRKQVRRQHANGQRDGREVWVHRTLAVGGYCVPAASGASFDQCRPTT